MRAIFRWVLCLLLAAIALEVFFVARIAVMAAIDPESTAFQRSEAWQIATNGRANGDKAWAQRWVPYDQISDSLKRAVIASEDGEFLYHQGVEWEAIEKARERNAKAEELAARRAAQAARTGKPVRAPKLRGGSTITQQLAKNLLLSGERTMVRKGQELVLATTLELLLSKRRILEIYLNNVEWGEGVFGAEAAAQRYFRKPASRLNAGEAARLAVMLPSPKFFEGRPGSAYLASRTATIVARMPSADLP
ncbi:transglycosylase domain-containing protein [Variovorax sp. J22R133]|uniref:transglycosylase domain-containing protein n=1 Tax=Variovorax brevis TaxID=3053503 RepID=UPI0025759F9F|nr:transglycosylase domain-containing protein [Variovorax sp. J22R133]MDM0114571.1 transglycosylase domain-containing protein [Variovorax sp. J22R133]